MLNGRVMFIKKLRDHFLAQPNDGKDIRITALADLMVVVRAMEKILIDSEGYTFSRMDDDGVEQNHVFAPAVIHGVHKCDNPLSLTELHMWANLRQDRHNLEREIQQLRLRVEKRTNKLNTLYREYEELTDKLTG